MTVFNKVYIYLASFAAAVAAVFGVYLLGRRKGVAAEKAEARTEALEKTAEAIKEVRNVEKEVSSLSDDAVAGRARKWVRKG